MGAFLYKYGPLVARVLVAPIFLVAAFHKFADLGSTAAYIASAFVTQLGVDPMAATWSLWRPLAALAGAIEVVGALMLLAGYRARFGAFLLFVYLIPVTIIVHYYGWKGATDPQAASLQLTMLLKNLAIMGALVQLATYGPGRPSVDVRS